MSYVLCLLADDTSRQSKLKNLVLQWVYLKLFLREQPGPV